MSELRLVIFDVDGTLVDSEGDIYAAMQRAYASVGVATPPRAAVRSIVGLSLDVAFSRLSPTADTGQHAALVDGYKNAYQDLRLERGAAIGSPLFPGAEAVLAELRAEPWTLLAVATGKSKRGLDKLIEGHGLQSVFCSQQVSDFHPSKPHPSMIQACLAETGVAPNRTVMVGDTSYDMDMAHAAGVRSIGVSWGYHPVADLQADRLIDRFADLPQAIDELLKDAQ